MSWDKDGDQNRRVGTVAAGHVQTCWGFGLTTAEETWLLTANLYRKLCHLNWENGRGVDQPINLGRRTLLAFGFLERIGTGIAVIAFVGGSGVVVLMGNTGRTLFGTFMKHT